jgi:hypothetical protein
MKEGRLLGHIVSAKGFKIYPSRVEAIQALAIPRSRKEVQSFLGKINFVRRFVSNFVEVVKFITTMLRKAVITEISSAQGDKNSASSTQKNSHSWHKD